MMNQKNTIKNLYCVEYPGNVKNEDRMIQSLGGINKISNAFTGDGSKLECKFRPEDRFCKGTTGEKNKSSNFLLKIRVKKTTIKNEDGTLSEHIQYTPIVAGKVVEVFRFKNLTDFQYLPIERNESGKLISLHESIVPTSLKPLSWFDEPTLSYLPPSSFARIDTVQSYLSSKPTDEPGLTIGRTRDRRSNFVKFVSHECTDIPDIPNSNALRYLKTKQVNEEQILALKKLFEKRPVWTRNALANITQFPPVPLKYLLALSAYHFTSGPYRIAWVRFGYDPRKDPTARQYQIIDYRIRGTVQMLLVERYPDRYAFRNKFKSWKDDKTVNEENCYIFKPGYLPPHRQMFYQLCDIHVPEVQQKLENIVDSDYDVKNGWLSEEFCNEVRKIIDKCILETLNSAQGNEKGDVELDVNMSIDDYDNKSSDDELDATDDEIDFENDEDITTFPS